MTKTAVGDGMSVVQIRNLYKIARTEQTAHFRVYLKYQMSRSDNAGQTFISRGFGDRLLSLLSKYPKQDLAMLLEFAVMLYEYTKQEQRRQKTSYLQLDGMRYTNKTLSDNLKKKVEEVVKVKTSAFGYIGLNIETNDVY